MNIENLGLKNFRLVRDNYFNFSDIVILVGANNSGKSSLLKALLLVSKSLKKFPILDNIDLKGNNPSLGSFENILSEIRNNQKLSITLPFEFIINEIYIADDLKIKFTFSNENSKNKYYPELIELQILDINDLKILDVKNNEIPQIIDGERNSDSIVNEQTIFLNFGWYKEKFNVFLEMYKIEPEYYKRKLESIDSYLADAIEDIEVFLNSERYFSDFKLIENHIHKVAFGWLGQERDFRNGKINKFTFSETLDWFFNECFPFDKLVTFNSEIGIEEEIDDDNPIRNGLNGLIARIQRDLFFSISRLNKKFVDRVSYIEAYRGSIDRLYAYNNESFNQLLADYIELELSSKESEYQFLTRWINENKFNFDNYNFFEIIPYSNFNANVVVLKKRKTDKKGKALADFGYGTLQIFTILLKIVVEAKRNRTNIGMYRVNYDKHTILIEEPESNLHPKWQALLSEMFADAIKTFNTQFIIETHSEYLIRKLQYLVAKNLFDSSQVKIFNFKKKSQISEVRIDGIGNLKTELGVDFFDESTTLKDELLKVQKLKELESENQKLNAKLEDIDGNNKCVFFTEDEDTTLLKHVLRASGFNLEETEIYSYEGCSNLLAAKLISEYIKGKFPEQKIVIHRDRDYLSLEETENWKENLYEINIHPFITKGTEVEYYYLDPNHINQIHNEISVTKAKGIVDTMIREKREISIVNMKKHEFGEKYKKKKTDLNKYFEMMYNENPIRYTDSKKVFSSLKQKIKDETKINARISEFSIFLKDEELERIGFEIWK